MTGFRVAPRPAGTASTGVTPRPVHLRQGHRRRAARPRRSAAGPTSWPCSPRPVPSTRPARCPGTRWRPPPASRRCGLHATRSTPHLDATAATVGRLASRGADQGGRAAPAAARGEPVQRLLRRPSDGARLRRRARAGAPTATPRSSTRCSTRASTCRPARSRPGSSRPPTTTAPLDRVADALPGAARAGRRGGARAPPRAVRLSHHRRPPGAARRGRTTPRRPLRPAAGLPPVRARAADGRRRGRGLADRDITYVVSSPLERALETAAPSRRRTASRSPTTLG